MTGKALLTKLFSNWIVKLLSIAAAVVLFLFQRVGSMEERFFSIPLVHYVNETFIVTDISAGSVRINMRGPEAEIFNVLEDDIEAYVDITDHESEGIFRSPVLLRKTGSAETVDVEMRVDPLMATVTIESRIAKELEVVTRLNGYPASGYELVQTLTTPRVLEISGPRSRVEQYDRLQTSIVDLTGRKADFTVRVPVELSDEMITVAGSSIIEIYGIVREIIIERPFTEIPLNFVNLSPDLASDEKESAGVLVLSGPQLAVEALRTEDLSLEIDCRNVFEPGQYELPVRPRAPSELEVVSFEPGVVSVNIAQSTILGDIAPSGASDQAAGANESAGNTGGAP